MKETPSSTCTSTKDRPNRGNSLSSRAKTSTATLGIVEVIGPGSLRRDYLLDDQLTDLAVRCQLNSFFTGVIE
jgi:hypothetical protein